MLQAYDKKTKTIHDIVKVGKDHYMLKEQKGSFWGPMDKTKAELVQLCKTSGYLVF